MNRIVTLGVAAGAVLLAPAAACLSTRMRAPATEAQMSRGTACCCTEMA
jgi:hypothetical protein